MCHVFIFIAIFFIIFCCCSQIDGNNVHCDESSLTGEPDAKFKLPGVYMKSGALVCEGDGRMLTLAVGINTDEGKAMMVLSEEDDGTPLQAKLDKMATLIGKIGLGMAVITVLCLVVRFAVCRAEASGDWKYSELQVLLSESGFLLSNFRFSLHSLCLIFLTP
jgi:Ca2+-transporting ATPase